MSCADRNFADLGTKFLAVEPLGLQVVDPAGQRPREPSRSLAGVARQSAFRCGAPSFLSFRVLKRTTEPGTRLRALIWLRPVPVNT